ncbi:MAG: hypothetical protein BRC34_06440 [Cyanobacteria bacterium QH_1_48_107]|nr:MAG: hypothetical protein BRC34_06440 [Cyanobacteria bacterium QH_1_48_107]
MLTNMEESCIENYLKRFRGEKIRYILNPGNAGDALIATATYQVFERIGLTYSTDNPDVLLSDDEIGIYAGGGNLISQSRGNSCRNFLLRNHSTARKIILLPHTITGNEDLLSQLGNNVTLICRENYSYNYTYKVAKEAKVLKMPDMAFLLHPNQLTKIEIPFKDRLKLLGPLLWLALQKEGKSLFRTDKESCQNTISRRNLDLANYLRNGPYNPEKAGLASRKMLYCLSKQNLIKTDRLHIAIGGGLLEKRVHLYGNNYFKNYAVFHYGIKQRLPSVEWKRESMAAV